MDDHYLVETPEIVAVAYDVAGIGSRCLAAVVDTALILALQLGLGALLLMIGSAGGDTDLSSPLLAIWALGSFLLLWGYYLLFELIWSGQSPGKRLLGLRVVREGGRPITFAASAVRNLIRAVDFLPLLYGVGAVAMFADPRSRRLGDLAAGSLVVREGATISLDRLTAGAEPAAVSPRPADAPPTPLLPNLHLIGPAEYELAQDFLRRRATIDERRRAELAGSLAEALRARLGLPSDGSPELFVEHFVREYRVAQQSAAPLTPDPAPQGWANGETRPPGGG
jgi:uncharacterized RDD family membrane protein YckC